MKAARRSIALVSGALLYSFGTGAAMKYASIGLPRSVYKSLGGKNSLSVMLGEAAVLAAILFIVALVWSYLTLRPARRRHRPYTAWMLAGVGLAWSGWLIFGAFTFALQPRAYSAPLQTMLLSSDAAPLFGVLNIVGIVMGVWLAGKLAKRRQLRLPTTRSRRRQEAAAARVDSDAGHSTIAPHTVSPPLAP
jgi:multisubunit Na+/H+ antiporter MnhB subunit